MWVPLCHSSSPVLPWVHSATKARANLKALGLGVVLLSILWTWQRFSLREIWFLSLFKNGLRAANPWAIFQMNHSSHSKPEKEKKSQNKKNNWKIWSVLERRPNLFIFKHRLLRNHFLSLKMVAWRWPEQQFWFRTRFIEPRSCSSTEAVQIQGRNVNVTSMCSSFSPP